MSKMKVYVVLEEDHGHDEFALVGVYRNREDAERVAETARVAGWVVEEELQ